MPFQAQVEASRGCQCLPAGLEQAGVTPQVTPVHSNLRQFAHQSEPLECSPCESAFQWDCICHLPSFSGRSERDAFLFRLNQIFIIAAASGTAGLRQHFLPKMPFLGSPGSLQLLPLSFPASASEQTWGGQNPSVRYKERMERLGHYDGKFLVFTARTARVTRQPGRYKNTESLGGIRRTRGQESTRNVPSG